MALFAGSKIYYGWIVAFASALIVFGASGSNFSFGVFLKPMTEELGWSRTQLSTAFAVTFMLSGLLRPVGGYLTDRYSPRMVALTGVAIVGTMLILLTRISELWHLFTIFSVMSIGMTLAAGPTLTKVISSWFLVRRGVMLGLVNGGGAVGGMVLVPASATFIALLTWRQAYLFLGVLMLCVILPLGLALIRNRPQDMGLLPEGAPPPAATGDGRSANGGGAGATRDLLSEGSTLGVAFRTSFFWKLTIGYFV